MAFNTTVHVSALTYEELEVIILVPTTTTSWKNWNLWPFLDTQRWVCGDSFIPKSGESDTHGEVKPICPPELERKGDINWKNTSMVIVTNCWRECGLLWEPGTLRPIELEGVCAHFLGSSFHLGQGEGKSSLWNIPRFFFIIKADSPGERALQELFLSWGMTFLSTRDWGIQEEFGMSSKDERKSREWKATPGGKHLWSSQSKAGVSCKMES